MTLGTATGAFLGLAVGGGLVLTWSRFPVRRRPTLDARLAPYVGELSAESARRRYMHDTRTVTPFPTLERLVRPHLAEARGLLRTDPRWRFIGSSDGWTSRAVCCRCMSSGSSS